MNIPVEPIEVKSLKDAVVQKLESWILSGELKIGEKLPSERILATKMKISRPVLHEALVNLAAKGLVRIEARRGVYINDYRLHGSCALLSSLLNFQQVELDLKFQSSLIEMRMLIETETSELAAQRCQPEHLKELTEYWKQKKSPENIRLKNLWSSILTSTFKSPWHPGTKCTH